MKVPISSGLEKDSKKSGVVSALQTSSICVLVSTTIGFLCIHSVLTSCGCRVSGKLYRILTIKQNANSILIFLHTLTSWNLKGPQGVLLL